MELLRKISLILVFVFLSITSVFSQRVIHDLKNNPLDIKNFDQRNYSSNKNAIYFEADKDSPNTGRLIVNISTKEQDDIRLSWQNTTANKVKTQWTSRLQYRLSLNDEWKDVADEKGRSIVFYSQYKRYKQNFSNIKLPEECENKDFVQISWLVSTNGNKNNSPQILFRNIFIQSNYDKYFGVEAEVNAFVNEMGEDKKVEKIVFDNIAIPFIYPEVQRIKIESKNIRDGINFEISGTDKSQFSVSKSSLKDKQEGKYIFVNYSPNAEGKHKAFLDISTAKLKQGTIHIPLEGSCSKHKDYNKNFIPSYDKPSKEFSYHIPVFSNTDYQYSFSTKKRSNVYVLYKWYRNDKELFSMNDTLRSDSYCVPLKSPKGADEIEIKVYSNEDFVLENSYFGLPKVKTMISSGLWSDDNNWKDGNAPTMEDFVVIAKNVQAEVDEDVSCTMLILEDSANVVINNNKIFYVASDIFYTQKSFFTVYQYLLPERWNYISSPVNQARAAMFSMKNDNNDAWFMQYNTGIKSKLDDYWSDYITDPKFTLVPGKGYAVYTHAPLNVKYEGLLCASSVAVSLKSTPDDRWNMIGNPYTAPLSSKKLFDELEGKIQGNAIMLFDRENRVYNPLIVDPKEEITIPSLESFFVEALSNPSNILFKRSQQYIPLTGEQAQSNHNYLNLSVSKNKTYQYALLGMDSNASYGFDNYDCHKLFGNNENMPEIYLKDEDDEYSVNVFPDYPVSIDVGLYIGNPSDVEININNLSVLPEDVVVIMEDKERGEFYDFCDNASLKTFIGSGITDRYRIHIIKALSNKKCKNVYVWTDNGRCLVYSKDVNLKKVRLKSDRNTNINERDYTADKVLQMTLKAGKYIDLNINDNWINIDIK